MHHRSRLLVAAGCAAVCLVAAACAGGSSNAGGTASGRSQSTPTTTGTGSHSTKSHHHRHRKHRKVRRPRRAVHIAGVPAVDLPRPALTPGGVLTTSRATVCTSGYASSVRDVPYSEKEQAYVRYGVAHVPYQHEVDHLVSLELGGSNAITNLWPEPYAGRWGAGTKDILENRLHDLVCGGQLGLAYAQHIEATNWVAAYRRYVGAPPPASSGSPGGGSSGGGSSGGGSSGSCTPGYSPCLVDHGGADYDCYGGGGNGPYYTAPGVTYTVTGSDPYRLDANHDGRACG
jgi:hypothetical protein